MSDETNSESNVITENIRSKLFLSDRSFDFPQNDKGHHFSSEARSGGGARLSAAGNGRKHNYARSYLKTAPSHGGDLVVLGRIIKSLDVGYKVLVVESSSAFGRLADSHLKHSSSFQVTDKDALKNLNLGESAVTCLSINLSSYDEIYPALIKFINTSEYKIELILTEPRDYPKSFEDYLKNVPCSVLSSIFMVLHDRSDNGLSKDLLASGYSELSTPFQIQRHK